MLRKCWKYVSHKATKETFGHCVVCPSSIYGFLFPLWYLQTLLFEFLLSQNDFAWTFCYYYTNSTDILGHVIGHILN